MSVSVEVKLVISQTTVLSGSLFQRLNPISDFYPRPLFSRACLPFGTGLQGGEVQISLDKMGHTFKTIIGHQLSLMPFNVNRQYRTFLMATLIKPWWECQPCNVLPPPSGTAFNISTAFGRMQVLDLLDEVPIHDFQDRHQRITLWPITPRPQECVHCFIRGEDGAGAADNRRLQNRTVLLSKGGCRWYKHSLLSLKGVTKQRAWTPPENTISAQQVLSVLCPH